MMRHKKLHLEKNRVNSDWDKKQKDFDWDSDELSRPEKWTQGRINFSIDLRRVLLDMVFDYRYFHMVEIKYLCDRLALKVEIVRKKKESDDASTPLAYIAFKSSF